MMDGWAWFRETADAELGVTPAEPDDRLGAVVAQANRSERRRATEIAAVVGVALLSFVLLGATVVVGLPNRTSDGPSLPPPTEVIQPVDGEVSPAPAPAQVDNGSPGPTTTGPVPRRTIVGGRPATPAPVTSRASAPGSPTAPTSTIPRRSTPPPTPTPTVTPTPTPPPTSPTPTPTPTPTVVP